MSSYSSCPYCGREAKDAISSSWFPLYRCADCDCLFCEEDSSDSCPKCGSDDTSTSVHRVDA